MKWIANEALKDEYLFFIEISFFYSEIFKEFGSTLLLVSPCARWKGIQAVSLKYFIYSSLEKNDLIWLSIFLQLFLFEKPSWHFVRKIFREKNMLKLGGPILLFNFDFHCQKVEFHNFSGTVFSDVIQWYKWNKTLRRICGELSSLPLLYDWSLVHSGTASDLEW